MLLCSVVMCHVVVELCGDVRVCCIQVLPPHLGGLNTEYGEAIKESEGFRSGGTYISTCTYLPHTYTH